MNRLSTGEICLEWAASKPDIRTISKYADNHRKNGQAIKPFVKIIPCHSFAPKVDWFAMGDLFLHSGLALCKPVRKSKMSFVSFVVGFTENLHCSPDAHHTLCSARPSFGACSSFVKSLVRKFLTLVKRKI